MIQDFCIINRFDVVSTVCDGCIGCTQFNICDTAGDAAKRSGKVCIAPYITIGIFVSLCSMSKGCKTKVVQIFQAKLRGYILKTLNGNGIDRITDCCTDRSGAIKAAACIIDRCADVVGDWLVFISYIQDSKRNRSQSPRPVPMPQL